MKLVQKMESGNYWLKTLKKKKFNEQYFFQLSVDYSSPKSVVCYNSVKVCSCLSCCIILVSVKLKEYLKIVESR